MSIKDSKICFKCLLRKPLEDFYSHPQMTSGRLGKCKECAKADARKHYYGAGRINVIEYERKRFKTSVRKELLKKYKQKSKIVNPLKWKARHAVSNAIRDGKLVRKPCVLCGDLKSQAHHTDYSKPLQIQWLCRPHHMKMEGKVPF